MKKLIIAAAIVCAAVISQAATVSWGAMPVEVLDASATTITSAWAFDTKNLTQGAFLALFAESKTTWQASGTEGFFDEGMGFGEIDGYANLDAVNLWAAFFDDKGNVLISGVESTAVGGAGQDPMPFLDLTEATAAGIFKAADGFQGAGWYTATSEVVPEPTSGLLLLLGIAGLALKRKHA